VLVVNTPQNRSTTSANEAEKAFEKGLRLLARSSTPLLLSSVRNLLIIIRPIGRCIVDTTATLLLDFVYPLDTTGRNRTVPAFC
jgi:hypothetical protein